MPRGTWIRTEESKANYRKSIRKRILKELGLEDGTF